MTQQDRLNRRGECQSSESRPDGGEFVRRSTGETGDRVLPALTSQKPGPFRGRTEAMGGNGSEEADGNRDFEARPVGQSEKTQAARRLGAPPEGCNICKGHGNIWVNWHPTPVTCRHCHGTGRKPEEGEPCQQ